MSKRKNTDDELVRFKAIVDRALAGVDVKHVGLMRLCIGEGGLPHRLELPGEMPGMASIPFEEHGWTFYDEAELRRLMLAIGRRALEALERRAATCTEAASRAQDAAAVQAKALNELEGSL